MKFMFDCYILQLNVLFQCKDRLYTTRCWHQRDTNLMPWQQADAKLMMPRHQVDQKTQTSGNLMFCELWHSTQFRYCMTKQSQVIIDCVGQTKHRDNLKRYSHRQSIIHYLFFILCSEPRNSRTQIEITHFELDPAYRFIHHDHVSEQHGLVKLQ